MSELPTGVGLTALAVAIERHRESARKDRLFDDRLAGAFVAAVGDAVPTRLPGCREESPLSDTWTSMEGYLPLRTRFFDDQLLDAAAAGIRQFVVLAAGLDSRAFRLTWPAGVHLYELDFPDMIAFKNDVIARSGEVP